MCELCRINFDRHSPDSAIDKMCLKRGMFVSVQPDGWEWSKTERGPGYTIIKLPGVSEKHPSIERLFEPLEDKQGRRRLVHKSDEWTKDDAIYCESILTSLSDKLVRLHSKCTDLMKEQSGN